MFATDDDELDFSAAASSTKLATLFEADHTLMHSGNQSLMYTAPKQPGKKPRSHTKEAANQDSAVQSIHATVVRAYKYDGTKYVEQGRLGVAIVGNKSTCSYSLLIFKGKQQAVTAAGFSSTFQYTVQNNNYATFYDDNRQNWSINFDSEANSIDFAKQVALAKFNSCGTSNEKVTVQDLVFCDGNPVKEDDNLYVKYCGTIIDNQRFGKVFDGDLAVEHSTLLKLGDNKIIKGWQEGVLGCKVGGHRIILIPASLGYGSKGLEGKVPQNCPIAIEMKIVDVNMPQNVELSAVLANSPDPSHSSADDGSIKARVASISEQLSHTSKTDKKAKIISRMAKMGQPMLPLRGAVPARLSSESETEDDVSGEFEGRASPKLSSPEPRPSRPAPRPRQRAASPTRTQTQAVHNIPQQGSPFYQMTTYPQQQPQVTLGHLGQPHMPYALMPQQTFATQSFAPNSGIDAHVPVLMAEVRTQNVELRMSVAKVTDKLDQVMSKLDHMSVGTSDKRATSLPAMDTEILARSIQKIIQDNEQMKAEISEKNAKLEMQSDKISELLQKNQRFFEQSNNMFFQQSESLQMSTAQSQNRIFQLEQEKTKLTLELTELKARLSINENQEVQLTEKLKYMRETSDRYESELGTLRLKVSELEAKETAAQKQMSEERQQWNQLQSTTSQSNETIIFELRAEKEILEKKLSNLLEKSKEDLSTACQENENLKSQHEEQLTVLQSRLHELEAKDINHKTSQEEELKTDQSNALDEVKQQYIKQVESLKSENELLKVKLDSTEKQMELCNTEIQTLKGQLSDAENLLKDSVIVYEEKISLLEMEKGDGEKPTSVDVVAEIKKVMNGVYGALRREFVVDETYQGSEVQKVLLATIRDVTLHLLERQENEASQNSRAVEEKKDVAIEGKQAVTVEETQADDREENTGQVKSELASRHEEVTNEEVPEQLHVTEATGQESEKKASSEASVTSVSDESWKPQPPPLFDDLLDEDDDDWLK